MFVSQPTCMCVCNVVLFFLSSSAEKRRVYDRYGKEGLKSGGMGGGGKPGAKLLVWHAPTNLLLKIGR